MHKRRWLALVLILVMGMGIMSGCSPTEKSFYSLMMEMSTQKVFSVNGSFQISLAQMPTSAVAAGEGAFDQAVLMRALNQHRIDYTGAVDLDKQLMQYNFSIVDTGTSTNDQVLTMLARQDMLYFKIDGLIDYLGQYCTPTEKQKLEETLGDVVWVSMSNQELNAAMPEGSPVFADSLFRRSSTQQTIWQRLADGLVNDVYKNYQSGLVTQKGNQYTLTIQGNQLINIVKPAAVYTINNIDTLGSVLKTFLQGLSANEMSSLGWSEATRSELLQGVDSMVLDVEQNRNQYLSALENMNPAAASDLLPTLNDSQVSTTLEKADAKTYKQDTRLHVHISSGYPVETMEFTISQQNTMIAGGNVQVTAPSSQVITYTELEKRMPHQMVINVDSGAYYSNRGFISSSGTMEVHLADNYTYLPLRLIGESLGEKIGWDQALYQAYAEQNGQRIYMSSLYFNNRAFMKIRDFERLGYTVIWDAANRTAIISK